MAILGVCAIMACHARRGVTMHAARRGLVSVRAYAPWRVRATLTCHAESLESSRDMHVPACPGMLNLSVH